MPAKIEQEPGSCPFPDRYVLNGRLTTTLRKGMECDIITNTGYEKIEDNNRIFPFTYYNFFLKS